MFEKRKILRGWNILCPLYSYPPLRVGLENSLEINILFFTSKMKKKDRILRKTSVALVTPCI